MRADRLVERRLACVKTGLGLEPLAVMAHQADQRDRHVADAGGKIDEVVEIGFWLGVEDVIGAQRVQTFALAGMGIGQHCRGIWSHCYGKTTAK